MSQAPAADGADNSAQRIDKWLWQARFFKTRTIASKFVSDGNVRITRNETTTRVEKASAAVRAGDMLIFNRNDQLCILRVLGCGERRGPAPEARALYEDMSPPPPKKGEVELKDFARNKGSGRPTKKDRRALSALKSGD